jgi:hypothetical protein
MKLYRLKDKNTGKYLAACSLYRSPQWTASGVFFRKIDTIRKHAEAICRDWGIEQKHHAHGFTWRVKETAHHPERMKNLIVVVNDVTLNGEEEIAATKIFKKGKK